MVFLKRKWLTFRTRKESRNKPEYIGRNKEANSSVIKPRINKLTSIGKEKKNEPKLGWLETISNNIPFLKKPNDQPSLTKSKETSKKEEQSNMRSWFSFTKHTEEHSDDVRKSQKSNEVDLMKKMCAEYRDVMKLQNKEEREERQRELAKVRGARTFFQTMDTSSFSSNPRIKYKTDDDVLQSFSHGDTKSKLMIDKNERHASCRDTPLCLHIV